MAEITCHKQDPHITGLTVDEWRLGPGGLRKCSYCGSMDPMQLVKLWEEGHAFELEVPEGADHAEKLYVSGLGEMRKLAARHLEELSASEFEKVAAMIKAKTGMLAARDADLCVRIFHPLTQRTMAQDLRGAAPTTEIGPDTVPITIHIPSDKVERLARAIEMAGCVDSIECIVEAYRSRVHEAFARYCPDKHFTGTPLDLDTLFAVLDNRLDKLSSGYRRRASDPRGESIAFTQGEKP